MRQTFKRPRPQQPDPSGNPIGLDSGVPQQIVNGFYRVQSYLALVTSARVTAVLLQDRDSFSASLGRQKRHQLPAATTATTAATRSSPAGSSQNYDTLVFSLRPAYSISETLAAYARYSWTNGASRQ